MIPFVQKGDILYCTNPDITVDEVKHLFGNGKNYVVVLDNQHRLVKLAFKKDVERIKVASAISTHEGWKRRVEENVRAGVDLIVIDTSDGHSDFTYSLLQEYRNMDTRIPICAGNVVTYDGAYFLMEAGADIVKIGMSSGSICTTQREKAVGRGPMTALIEVDRARQHYLSSTGKNVSLITDGGITSSADMIIALTIADALMMGYYFNRFYESAGEKFDRNGKITYDEAEMTEVATWGEGSMRARNLDRYGHITRRTFFEEGIEGTVPYIGRLKRILKRDLMKVKSALSNAGCINLDEFREKAVIELNSPYTTVIVSNVHDVKQRD